MENIFEKLKTKILYIFAETLFGFSVLCSVLKLTGSPVDFNTFLFPLVTSIVLNILLELRPIITLSVILLALGGVAAGYFYLDFDIITITKIVLSFLTVCWAVLWRGKRFGLSATVLILLIFNSIPYFRGGENDFGLIVGILSVIPFSLLYIPSKARQKKIPLSKTPILSTVALILCITVPAVLFTVLMPEYPVSSNLRRKIMSLNVYSALTKSTPDFDIAEMGFQGDETTIGGPTSPKTNAVMDINSNHRTYLRCRIFDQYTGYSWKRSAELLNYPFSKIFYTSDFNDIFDIGKPSDTALPDEFFTDIEMTINPRSSFFRSIPTPFRFNELSVEYSDDILLIYNNLGEVFGSDFINDEITISGRIPDIESEAFALWMMENADSLDEPVEKMNDLRDIYCSLPEVPAAVSQAAAEIVGNGNSYQKAKKLEYWLKTTKEYTYTPRDDYSRTSDFVENFLNINEGYCVYFASAMTVMLRTQGIPARYVTGFTMPAEKNIYGLYTVLQSNAHAWCEVYFEGIGWIPFEPTASISDSTDIETPAENVDPIDTMPERPASQESQDQLTPESETSNGRIDPLMSLFVVILFACYLAVCYFHKKIGAKIAEDSRLKGWYTLERLLSDFGLRRETHETLSDFAVRCEQNAVLSDCLILKTAEYSEKILYQKDIEAEDHDYASDSLKAVLDKLKEKSRIKWLFRKIFL